MEMLLWASILEAIVSLIGILVLVLTACFCMPDRRTSEAAPLGGKSTRKDASELVIQITQVEEQPIHGIVMPPEHEVREQSRSQTSMQQQTQTAPTSALPEHNAASAVVTSAFSLESATGNNVIPPSSAPTSVTSPKYVPMHAVSHSVPVSAPTSTASPRSVPSDWFNNSDEPSLSDFMGTTKDSGTK